MKTNVEFLNERNEMLKYVGYECEVVRKDSIEWENGVIIGVMSDKRSNVNMFRIECIVDKKVINKTFDNKLFKISNKVSSREIKSRNQSYDNLSREEILKKIELLSSEIKVLREKLDLLD